MTKEFILANFCFGSPPLLIPPRPQVLLRALNIVLFGIDEKEALKLNTSAGTVRAFQKKTQLKSFHAICMVFKSFPPFTTGLTINNFDVDDIHEKCCFGCIIEFAR